MSSVHIFLCISLAGGQLSAQDSVDLCTGFKSIGYSLACPGVESQYRIFNVLSVRQSFQNLENISELRHVLYVAESAYFKSSETGVYEFTGDPQLGVRGNKDFFMLQSVSQSYIQNVYLLWQRIVHFDFSPI